MSYESFLERTTPSPDNLKDISGEITIIAPATENREYTGPPIKMEIGSACLDNRRVLLYPTPDKIRGERADSPIFDDYQDIPPCFERIMVSG
mgnify:CR=1 FL=1